MLKDFVRPIEFQIKLIKGNCSFFAKRYTQQIALRRHVIIIWSGNDPGSVDETNLPT